MTMSTYFSGVCLVKHFYATAHKSLVTSQFLTNYFLFCETMKNIPICRPKLPPVGDEIIIAEELSE